MTTKVLRRIALIVSGLAVALGMTVTPIHPAGANTHQDAQTDVATKLPPMLTPYGAIAVSADGRMGKAWNHLNRATAQQRALALCGPDCRVVSVFTNCGAVAHDGAAYHGGIGFTRQAAERHAMTKLGGGWVVESVCH